MSEFVEKEVELFMLFLFIEINAKIAKLSRLRIFDM